MRKQGLVQSIKLMLLTVLVVGCGSSTALAVTSNSNSYQVTEMELGGTTSSESCSGQYCAKASIGDMTEGGKSKNFSTTASFGSVTEGEPLLEVIVQPGESNLGILSSDKTATKTTTVQVRNYLSGGYMVQVTGAPPKYKDHTLETSNTPVASQPGTEQFGINAAANTSPQIGANVVQFPDDLTSFGKVEDDYKTPNLFKYTSGDVIARSLTESGQSTYTISMIVNVSNQTPAGHFAGDFAAIVIPVY